MAVVAFQDNGRSPDPTGLPPSVGSFTARGWPAGASWSQAFAASSTTALPMTPADSSRRAGTSGKHINQIIQGIAAITPDAVLALEQVPGVPAGRKTRR